MCLYLIHLEGVSFLEGRSRVESRSVCARMSEDAFIDVRESVIHDPKTTMTTREEDVNGFRCECDCLIVCAREQRTVPFVGDEQLNVSPTVAARR